MERLTDEQLVGLVLEGKITAFEILVNRYQKQIFALAYRLGGDYDEAQDMAQEAFVRIYRELARFDQSRSFFSWMYRVAHNVCINHLHKRPKNTTPLDDFYMAAENNSSLDALPPELFEQKEHAQMIGEAIAALPEEYRLPLVLKYLEDMSYQQIAEQMSLPVTTIETRLFRARNMLKKLLAAQLQQSG
ncbi:MAG: sigma-70 family RNA polymerase sigma factor [Bacillota bacterium]|nr:sigma-70 family RNA polymerase sigma factor [Bacillota bacterium]